MFSGSPMSASAHPANTPATHHTRAHLHSVLLSYAAHQRFSGSAVERLAARGLLPRPISGQPMVLPPTE
jgi:hypothetical protein